MKGIIPALLIVLLLAITGCAPAGKEADLSRPSEVITNADLDYQFLNNIDSITPPYPSGGKYQIGDLPTVKGKYTVHKYLVEYAGRSAEGGKSRFHDLIILKLDNDKKILDAYKYTLEWTDSPSLALYRTRTKGLYLKPGLKLKDLAWDKFVSARKEPLAPEQRLASPPGEKIWLGDEFAKDEIELNKKAEEIVKNAKSYKEARDKLIELQRQADFSWKGQGPQILDKYLEPLDKKGE